MSIKKRHNIITPVPSHPNSSGGSYQRNGRQNKNDYHPGHKHKPVWNNRRKNIIIFVLSLLLMIGILRSIFGALFSVSDLSLYGPPTNTTNAFVAQFEDALLNDLGHDFFVPLIFENGKLLCRRKHKQQLSSYRTRFFTQMVRSGIQVQDHSSIDHVEGGGGLPILVMDADGNGCNVHFRREDYGYPRLAWSILSSSKHGNHCKAIGMPSYETWGFYHRSHKQEKHWEQTFEQDEIQFPWSLKTNKAVWRGSTTYEGSQYHESALGETPRGKLVKKSMEHPELIDAAFHKINQKFQSQRHELTGQFTVAKRINPREMMKYKGMYKQDPVLALAVILFSLLYNLFFSFAAIIDIDGNNWSSRFGMLLCSNSVVIKVSYFALLRYIVKYEEHLSPDAINCRMM